jgi:hypothetical protein
MGERVFIVRCSTCAGMTACCVVEDGNRADARAAGRLAAEAAEKGRAIASVTVEEVRTSPVCKCPRPEPRRKVGR